MSTVDVQSRILSHMNKDHRLAIEDYLAVYGDVIINDKIANIKLKSIELDHMEISFNHFDIEFEIIKPIPIDPPMQDFSELRSKLVDMATYAANKRGYSHLQIQDISYPTKIWEYVLISLVFVCFFGAFYPHILYNYCLDYLLPSYLTFTLRKFNKLIAISLLLIHIVELKLVLLPKLNHYRVPTDFKIEWVIFCLIDGRASIERFNQLIKTDKKH